MNRPILWWVSGASYVLLLLGLSLSPNSGPPPLFVHADKLMHAGAHFVLCAWFLPAVHQRKQWRVLLFSVVLGLAIEGLQRYVPGREPSFLDLLANLSGALAAIALLRKPLLKRLNLLIFKDKIS